MQLASNSITAQVDALAAAMFAAPDLQVELEPVHDFADGLYSRTLTLPAGSIAVGHWHKQEHVCIVSQGVCEVVTEQGGRELTAPAVFVVPAGRRNCVRAITETTWTTVHAVPNECRDIDQIEAMLVDKPRMIGSC